MDKALCFTCCSAVEKKQFFENRSRADATFVKGGFSNWRKAVEKFREHERSSFHLESMNKIAALSSTPINALMSDIVAKEQKNSSAGSGAGFQVNQIFSPRRATSERPLPS